MMIKALLIDDEPLAREIVKEYLESYDNIEIVGECNDGFEGLKMIGIQNPDLLFLDVQMPRITGFEALELLEAPPAVIFTTAFDEYAIKAFEEQAIDYLLKPFSKDRFDQAVQKFISNREKIKEKTQNLLSDHESNQPSTRVVVRDGNVIKIISLKEILFLEAADDYVKIHTEKRVFLKKKTMRAFEKSLPESQFVRLHRSFIVNLSQISGIHPYEKDHHIAVLKTGQRIPLSKPGFQKLRKVLDL